MDTTKDNPGTVSQSNDITLEDRPRGGNEPTEATMSSSTEQQQLQSSSINSGGMQHDSTTTATTNTSTTVDTIDTKQTTLTATTCSPQSQSQSQSQTQTVPAPPGNGNNVVNSTRSTTTPTHDKPATTTTTTMNTTNNKKKKKNSGGGLASLFSCFGCGAANAFDDDEKPSAHNTSNKNKSNITHTTPTTSASAQQHQQQNAITSEKQPVQTSPNMHQNPDSTAQLNEKANLITEDSTTVKTDSAVLPPPLAPATTGAPVTPDSAVVVPSLAGGPTGTDTPRSDATPATTATAAAGGGVVLPQDETEGVTSGAVMPPGAMAVPVKTKRRKSGKRAAAAAGPESLITQVPEPGQRQAAIVQDSEDDGTEDSDEEDEEDEDEDEQEEDEEQNLIARGGVGIPIGEDGLPHPLLDDLAPELKGRKCLVLDLDETLVHSSFKMVHQADYVVPVEIENQYHNVYVIKRPGVDAFLKAMGEIYEIVIFTASLSKYADPVLDQLDIHRVVQHRLFRESCYNNKGTYVKDLSQLGRPMRDCIIIDNSPASYVFHVNNAVPISSWFNDPHDTELTDLVPFLTDLHQVDDIRSVLDAGLYQHLALEQ